MRAGQFPSGSAKVRAQSVIPSLCFAPAALLIATRFSANFDPKSEVFALISTKKINRVTRPIAPTPPSLSFVGLTLKCCATFSDKFWTVFRCTCPHMYVHNWDGLILWGGSFLADFEQFFWTVHTWGQLVPTGAPWKAGQPPMIIIKSAK